MEIKKKFRIPEPLWQAKKLGQRVDDAYNEYRAVYWRLTNTAAPPMGDKVVGAGGNDMYVSIGIKAEKLERLRRQYDRAVRTASEVISRLEDARHRAVLTHRYIEGMTPKESAQASHYSMDWERTIHREAIKAFEKEMGR
jgi:hypothetical protein